MKSTTTLMMLSCYCLVGALVVLGCCLGPVQAAGGVEITFTNETFAANGTNLVAEVGFTQAYASQTFSCTFNFPGGTFLQIATRYYVSFSSPNQTTTFPSTFSLSTGTLSFHNEGNVSFATRVRYLVWLHEQNKNQGQAFSFSLACDADGVQSTATIDNLEIVDNTGGGATPSPSPSSSTPKPSPSSGGDHSPASRLSSFLFF